jgi:hypothetical protein
MRSIISQGALVMLYCGSSKGSPPFRCSRRGVVSTFSSRSRRRLREKLHRLRWPSSVLFLTLTVDPSSLHVDLKYHLHRFLVGFLKQYTGWGAVWKLEFTQSGIPHFHILLIPSPDVRVPFVPHGELEKRWGLGFVWVERVFHNRVAAYLAKYVYKAGPYPGRQGGRWEVVSLDSSAITETPSHVVSGRFWGLRGTLRWAPVRLGAPIWAIRVAVEVKKKVEERLGIRLRGWLAVFLDRQVT